MSLIAVPAGVFPLLRRTRRIPAVAGMVLGLLGLGWALPLRAVELDIPVFAGSYGIGFYQQTARQFEALDEKKFALQAWQRLLASASVPHDWRVAWLPVTASPAATAARAVSSHWAGNSPRMRRSNSPASAGCSLR